MKVLFLVAVLLVMLSMKMFGWAKELPDKRSRKEVGLFSMLIGQIAFLIIFIIGNGSMKDVLLWFNLIHGIVVLYLALELFAMTIKQKVSAR